MKHPAASALALLLLATPTLLPAQTPEPPATAKTTPPDPRTLVDALAPAALDDFLKQLRDNYVKPAALSELELKRATVQGLLTRLAPGAALRPAPAGGAAETSPFRSEILDGRIGYLRLGSTTPANVAELDAALGKFTEQSLGALVLDLRATPEGSEFDQTAEICRRFVPKGKLLFTVKKPNVKQEQVLTSRDDPKFRGVVAVLVDADTAGNAEVIAAVLRTHVHALVIGQTTRGEGVEFSDLPLAGGPLLRIAVAEVTLPDHGTVFPGGVKPDLAVEVSAETTAAVLQQGLERGVADLVFEAERPRLNEAALVAGTNPELDAVQATQKAKGEKPKVTLRDAILQRAVDFITTLAIYDKTPGAAK